MKRIILQRTPSHHTVHEFHIVKRAVPFFVCGNCYQCMRHRYPCRCYQFEVGMRCVHMFILLSAWSLLSFVLAVGLSFCYRFDSKWIAVGLVWSHNRKHVGNHALHALSSITLYLFVWWCAKQIHSAWNVRCCSFARMLHSKPVCILAATQAHPFVFSPLRIHRIQCESRVIWSPIFDTINAYFIKPVLYIKWHLEFEIVSQAVKLNSKIIDHTK